MSSLLFLFLQRTNFVPQSFVLTTAGVGMSIRITSAARTARERVKHDIVRVRGMQSRVDLGLPWRSSRGG
jgi:hypothetical protein